MSSIEKLRNERVVSFSLNKENKTITVEELCDYYYSTTLNLEELDSFIEELKNLRDLLLRSF